MKKLLSMILVLVMIVSVLAGCGGSAATEAPAAAKDSVTIAIYQDIKTLDPHNSGMTIDKVVYQNVFDCLLNLYNGEYEKVLAEDYTISADGTEYTVILKKGIKFHNGEELKASDVVFSIERAMASTPMANRTASIESVKAVDDYTV